MWRCPIEEGVLPIVILVCGNYYHGLWRSAASVRRRQKIRRGEATDYSFSDGCMLVILGPGVDQKHWSQ